MQSRVLLSVSLAALVAPAALWQSREQPKPLVQTTAFVPVTTIKQLPFTITAPGRYVLAGGLDVLLRPVKGLENGIVIQADHVELDLDGHALVGAEGTFDGISIELPEKRTELLVDVCVRNGTVTSWGGDGVDLELVRGARLLDLRLTHNGAPRTSAAGLRAGPAALVQGCVALSNSGPGLALGEGSVVRDCLADGNALEGFVLASLASGRQCSATGNGRDGFLLEGWGSSLSDCAAGGNAGNGIRARFSASLRACSATNNGGSGLELGRSCLASACLANGNRGAGITAIDGLNRLEDNHLVVNSVGFQVGGSGNVVARNSISTATVDDSLLAASAPGGVFVADPDAAQLALAGVGYKPSAAASPTDVSGADAEGAAPGPWANIAVR